VRISHSKGKIMTIDNKEYDEVMLFKAFNYLNNKVSRKCGNYVVREAGNGDWGIFNGTMTIATLLPDAIQVYRLKDVRIIQKFYNINCTYQEDGFYIDKYQ